MRINKKRVLVIFLIANVLVFALSLGAYFVFMNAFNKDYAKTTINASQTVVKETTSKKLNEVLLLFAKETANNSLNELNALLEEETTLTDYGFQEFVAVNNKIFIYNEEVVNIETSYLKDYGFGFFNKTFYVYDEEVAGIIDLSVLLSQVFSFTQANDLLLLSNTGEIYYNLNQKLYQNVLYNYLNQDLTNYFEDYFAKNKEVVIFATIEGLEAIVSFTPVEGFVNLYVAEQFYMKDFKSGYLPLSLFLAALFGIIAVLNFGVLNLIYYLVNKRNADIENKKYAYYYNKPFIIKINAKGKIKSFNKRVKEELKGLVNKGENIGAVFAIEDIIVEKIDRGVPLVLKHEDKTISFLALKYAWGYYLVGELLTSSVVLDDEIYRLAYYNGVTNLPNLYMFHNDTKEKLAKLSPLDEEDLYFVGYKIVGVERSLGKISEYVKDLALKEIAKDLKSLAKQKNLALYNTNEDEFVYVLKEKQFKNIEDLVLKAINHFEKPMVIEKSKLDFKIRAAIVSVSGKESTATNSEEVYSHLIETLKRAVGSAHQKYVVFDEAITSYLTERQQTEQELRLAIDKGEFIPYLQAQYNYKEDKIVGFESLIRWDNPNYINKSPQTFIELAEETGLINQIGKIMTEKTFELAKKLEDYDISISLNVSPIEILRQGFVEELLALHKKYKLKPGSITLEITETTLLQSYMVINEKIRALKKHGIKIDLDDFGTGYSSLPYIKELDFDTIKIDKTFVDYIETDKYNKAIVQMIISLAKTLNVGVIAEGIETEKQMNYLVKAGCNIIQGFYISKPLPYLEAKQLLEDYNINKTMSFQKKGGK